MNNPLEALFVLAMISVTATPEEKQEMLDALKAEGEDCANCKRKDDCPIYDALTA